MARLDGVFSRFCVAAGAAGLAGPGGDPGLYVAGFPEAAAAYVGVRGGEVGAAAAKAAEDAKRAEQNAKARQRRAAKRTAPVRKLKAV